MAKKSGIYIEKRTIWLLVALAIAVLGAMVAILQLQMGSRPDDSLAGGGPLPTEINVVYDGVNHHVLLVSSQSCTMPTVGELRLSETGNVFVDTFTSLTVTAYGQTTMHYHHADDGTGNGGVTQLKKAGGCWQVTIGDQDPQYITVHKN